MELTYDNIDSIYRDVMYQPEEIAHLKKGELPEGVIPAIGVVARFGFHPERLANHRKEIESMIDQLSDRFNEDPTKGGGASFLEMCYTKDGQQWTGLHKAMDLLLCLGLAIGKMDYCAPREAWGMFPMAMPYVKVLNV